MNEKLRHLLEIYLASINDDFGKRIEHFELITSSLFNLTQSLFDNKEQIQYCQRELEGKLFRFCLANHSLIDLIKGNDLTWKDGKTKIGDIFSINSIMRMQIESYLIMYYLFFDEISETERNFRYDIYKLHGLQKQLNFKTPIETAEKKKDLEKINLEMDDALANIKNSPIYINASEKEKQAYLNPKYAKLIKSEVIFRNSGLNDLRIGDMWQIYSNYAHAEHISDRQYNTLYGVTKSIVDNCSLVLTVSSVMTSKLILNFKELFESVETEYSKLDSASKHHIEFWNIFKLVEQ